MGTKYLSAFLVGVIIFTTLLSLVTSEELKTPSPDGDWHKHGHWPCHRHRHWPPFDALTPAPEAHGHGNWPPHGPPCHGRHWFPHGRGCCLPCIPGPWDHHHQHRCHRHEPPFEAMSPEADQPSQNPEHLPPHPPRCHTWSFPPPWCCKVPFPKPFDALAPAPEGPNHKPPHEHPCPPCIPGPWHHHHHRCHRHGPFPGAMAPEATADQPSEGHGQWPPHPPRCHGWPWPAPWCCRSPFP